MNFADAIRQAALHTGAAFSPPAHPISADGSESEHELDPTTLSHTEDQHVESEQPTPSEQAPLADAGPATVQPAGAKPHAVDAMTAQPVYAPEPPSSQIANGSVVRLELFLSPEQLSGLFRAVIANQHSVMTMREAAQYLRMSASKLEQMAQEGEIPGMQIDGRWRFTRSAVDEWMSFQSFRKEMAS